MKKLLVVVGIIAVFIGLGFFLGPIVRPAVSFGTGAYSLIDDAPWPASAKSQTSHLANLSSGEFYLVAAEANLYALFVVNDELILAVSQDALSSPNPTWQRYLIPLAADLKWLMQFDLRLVEGLPTVIVWQLHSDKTHSTWLMQASNLQPAGETEWVVNDVSDQGISNFRGGLFQIDNKLFFRHSIKDDDTIYLAYTTDLQFAEDSQWTTIEADTKAQHSIHAKIRVYENRLVFASRTDGSITLSTSSPGLFEGNQAWETQEVPVNITEKFGFHLGTVSQAPALVIYGVDSGIKLPFLHETQLLLGQPGGSPWRFEELPFRHLGRGDTYFCVSDYNGLPLVTSFSEWELLTYLPLNNPPQTTDDWVFVSGLKDPGVEQPFASSHSTPVAISQQAIATIYAAFLSDELTLSVITAFPQAKADNPTDTSKIDQITTELGWHD